MSSVGEGFATQRLDNGAAYSTAGMVLAAVGLVVAGMTLSGCDPESCDQVRNSYQQALDSEPGLDDLTDEGSPHAAVSVDMDRLNDWTADLITAAVGDALSVGGSFNVEGQSVDYSVGSTGANLRLEASDACGACLRVHGDIDGDASVDLPLIGSQSTPLNGSMDWTVPLDVGLDGDDAAIFFDAPEAVRMGTPTIQASLDGLPGDWASPVASQLVDQLSESVAEEIDPIRLMGYELPDLGLGGVEIAPSMLALDPGTNTLTLGIRTNLPVEPSPGLEDEIADAMALDGGSAAALAVHPRLAVEGARMAMRGGDVPRRYTLRGEADDDGDAYALVDDLSADAHDEHTDALRLGLNFRAFNFRSWIGCFSMRGESKSRLAISDGQLEFEVEDVELSDTGGFFERGNWAAADFVDFSQLMITRSLDDDGISVPGVDVNLLPQGVSTEAGMVIMRTSGD